MEKVYRLAEMIRKECKRVVSDYKKERLSINFTDGVVINSYLTLKYMEEIWNIDLSKYNLGINIPED